MSARKNEQDSGLTRLLQADSRADLAWMARSAARPTPVGDARRITSRLNELGAPAHRLRLAILRSYTSEFLDPWLQYEAALQDLGCDVYHGPYGFFHQEAQEGSGLRAHQADACVLLLQRGDLHPDFQRPLAALDDQQRQALFDGAISSVAGVLQSVRSACGGLLIVSILPLRQGTGLGLYDALADRSEEAWWSRFKSALAAVVREQFRSVVLLDLDDVVTQIGRSACFDDRYWLTSRIPFSAAGAQEMARRIVAFGVLIKQPRAKVIVLDADNTLWGGVIGEDGMAGIGLGPDYPGNAFVEFQRRLLALKERGFVLALCSKNNEADLDQVLNEHPHQVLRAQDFVARRVNWLPKVQNLASLAEELNLGMDSFIFVDDSEHECLSVRQALPQVEVVRTPAHPLAVPACLDHVARLEVLALTSEDRAKTRMYAEESQRKALAAEVTRDGGGMEAFLQSLGMQMEICLDDASQVTRLAQLTQKTNQFNLTTRRYSEEQVRQFIEGGDTLVAHFSLADRFGHSGVVGLAILRLPPGQPALLDTFLMSCRVIGRRAEHAFLDALLAQAAQRGADCVLAEFLPTAKNGLAAGFLESAGFTRDEGGHWTRALRGQEGPAGEKPPIQVTLRKPAAAA